MIPSQEEKVLWIFDLITKQEENGLETLLPSVDVIPEEEIVGSGREATHLEEANEIRVLTVDITSDLDWWRKLEESGLVQEYFSSGLADSDNLGILQAQKSVDLAGVTNVQQT